MNWKDTPNPTEPLDSPRRVDAVFRVFKHIEETDEISEADKAEFMYCLYAFAQGWALNNSALSVKVLEDAVRKLFPNP